ncbi:MAG TPA: STAS domain-containing protein [Pirellulales bacterium]|jgi:anti-anti-sigma factor
MSSASAISIKPHDEVIYVVVHQPRLDDAALVHLQRELTAAAAKQPTLPVVLDLTQVNYVPSMALGTLVMLMRHLKDSNQRLVLVGLHQDVRTVLAITRLDKLFEIQSNLEAALKQLRGSIPKEQK